MIVTSSSLSGSSLFKRHLALVFWKDRGLFVRNKSIADLWFLVQHVLVLFKFVRPERLQNSSSLSTSIPAVLISILKSPIIMKFSYVKPALPRKSPTSVKKVSRLLKLGGLQMPIRNHFFLEMVISEQINPEMIASN